MCHTVCLLPVEHGAQLCMVLAGALPASASALLVNQEVHSLTVLGNAASVAMHLVCDGNASHIVDLSTQLRLQLHVAAQHVPSATFLVAKFSALQVPSSCVRFMRQSN